jgi:hypothetical protein
LVPPNRCLAHETIFRTGEIILKPTAVYQGSLVLAGVQDEFDGRGRSSTSRVMQRGHLSGARCRGLQHPVEAPLGASEDRCVVQSAGSRGPLSAPAGPDKSTFAETPFPSPVVECAGCLPLHSYQRRLASRAIFPLSIVSRLVRENAGSPQRRIQTTSFARDETTQSQQHCPTKL